MKKNGYEYVDLGFESGTMWATCNVGANKPWEPGLLFQFGRVDGYKYGDKNHKFRTNEQNLEDTGDVYIPITSSGKLYNKGDILKSKDDAAHINMGGKWKMPTYYQCKEMYENTTNTPIKDIGTIFTSNINGKQLFIPFAGYWYNGSFRDIGSYASIWSSSITLCNIKKSHIINCYSGGKQEFNYYVIRAYGFSVRGVFNK